MIINNKIKTGISTELNDSIHNTITLRDREVRHSYEGGLLFYSVVEGSFMSEVPNSIKVKEAKVPSRPAPENKNQDERKQLDSNLPKAKLSKKSMQSAEDQELSEEQKQKLGSMSKRELFEVLKTSNTPAQVIEALKCVKGDKLHMTATEVEVIKDLLAVKTRRLGPLEVIGKFMSRVSFNRGRLNFKENLRDNLFKETVFVLDQRFKSAGEKSGSVDDENGKRHQICKEVIEMLGETGRAQVELRNLVTIGASEHRLSGFYRLACAAAVALYPQAFSLSEKKVQMESEHTEGSLREAGRSKPRFRHHASIRLNDGKSFPQGLNKIEEQAFQRLCGTEQNAA